MSKGQFQFVAVCFFLCGYCSLVNAVERTIEPESVMLTVRAYVGPEHESSWLKPLPILKSQLKSGQKIELEVALFDMVGDLHLQIVEDTDTKTLLLSKTQFDALGLPISEVIDLAVKNIIKRYGEPEVTREKSGLLMIRGSPVDYVASMLFYEELWSYLERRYPGGLLVSVPTRHTLLLAPTKEAKALKRLRKMTRRAHRKGMRDAVSAKLYFRRDGRWHQQSQEP